MSHILTARARALALTLFSATSVAVVEDAGADVRRPCVPNLVGPCVPQPDPDPNPDPNHDYTRTTGSIVSSVTAPIPNWRTRLSALVTTTVRGPGVAPVSFRPEAGYWSVTKRPEGSVATFQDPIGNFDEADRPFHRDFTPDLPGRYEFEFTTCTGGCLFFGHWEEMSAVRGSIDVPYMPLLDFDPKPPATQVDSPPRAYDDADVICMNGIQGFTQPQWAVTSQWRDASSYVLLEGKARSSRPSGEDNFLNHHSNDFKMTVTPDKPFGYLLNANDDKNVDSRGERRIEVEWEQNELPEAFRPMNGDRVSVYGYHAFDCGHGHSTEVHPPVLLATHRPRMIEVPSNQPLYLSKAAQAPSAVGSNVWVGGIVSDVFVSRHGGEATGNCSTSGLHQPAKMVCGLPRVDRQPGTECRIGRGACISGKSPIKRVYEFNIYLPKNPAYLDNVVAGKEEAPLYVASYAHPDFPQPAAPQPTITPVIVDNKLSHLLVRIDLTDYPEAKWAQQIVAGWVLPDPMNHRMETWQVRLDSLKVHDESEGGWGDGDWNLWAAIPNVTNEWSRILNCNGCIEDGDTIRPTSRDWMRGVTRPDGTLIGDLHVLPYQEARLRMYGYDEDTLMGDDLGYVDVLLDIKRPPRSNEPFRAKAPGGKLGDYTVNYSFFRGTQVPTPVLSDDAKAIYRRFAFVDPNGAVEHTARTRRGSFPVDVQPEAEDEGERLVAGAMTAAQVRALAVANPAEVTTIVTEARTRVNGLLRTKTRAKVERKIAPLRDAVPAALWNPHFGDIFPKP